MSTDTTPPATVQSGTYYAFDAAGIADEKTAYVAAVRQHTQMRSSASGGTLQFVGINGKQLTYNMSDAQVYFATWRQELKNAEAQLAGDCMPHTDRAVARFS